MAPPTLATAVRPGATMGIGGLPHRSAAHAAQFALRAYDVPTIPNLPRRSPAELPINQALLGVPGVTAGPYGTVAIDVARLAPEGVQTDLDGDQYGGMRTFLELARGTIVDGPVAWHLAGPLSVGITLLRAGAPIERAFAVALSAVRAHLSALSAAVRAALGGVHQIVILDEPLADEVLGRTAPIDPGRAIDLLSCAMAAVESTATIGVHCCREVDPALLLDAGPRILSLPVSDTVVEAAGRIERYLAAGGLVAWGAVTTAGPVDVTARRSIIRLDHIWEQLAVRSSDPALLASNCLLTPECGLSAHSVATAERICHTLRDVGAAVRRR